MKKLKISVKIILTSLLIFIFIYGCFYYSSILSTKIDIKNSNSIYMYDKDNKTFYEGNNGSKKWVALKDISPYLVSATIYSEDKNFYSHNGFDIPRIFMSLFINIKNKELSQGASTISQQYARNLFLTFEKTWKRKIKEAWYAFKLENTYSKDEILEGYLNTINYGNGILGIENASYYYFNKSSKDLNLEEASILAGIPKSPNNYSPLNNKKNAKKRQKQILNTLVDNNIITRKEASSAYNKELTFYGKKDNLNLNTIMYYQDAVINELKELKIISEDTIKQEGLKIYTAFDSNAQLILEQNINNNLENKKEMQAAAIMMNPTNGEIIALAGGKDYSKSQYNRAIKAKRQVGSTMKPLLYLAALQEGLTPATTFLSKPTTFALDNNTSYSPKNYGDIYPNDYITMALAISYSDNIYSVKTHKFLGENTLVDISKKLGITTKLTSNASLPLGTSEITMDEFTNAYAIIANSGKSVNKHLIRRIENGKGEVIYKYKDNTSELINNKYTYILSEMLSKTYDVSLKDYTTPTCASIKPKLTKKYAVKSGTTDYDLWTIGYNKDIVVSVWTGYDDNRKLSSKEYKYAKSIWADSIEDYLRDKENNWYDKPDDVVGVITDLYTGKVADNNSKIKTLLYYVKGTEPGYKKTTIN